MQLKDAYPLAHVLARYCRSASAFGAAFYAIRGRARHRRSMIARLGAVLVWGGTLVLVFMGAVLVVAISIVWGLLVGWLALLLGLQEGAILLGLTGAILGVFPTVKCALWLRGRVIGRRERTIEELTEVF